MALAFSMREMGPALEQLAGTIVRSFVGVCAKSLTLNRRWLC
jgi:hypothetical protein